MGRTDTADRSAPAPDLASAVADAPFVRLVVRRDGDAIAASAILARTLDERGVPFQVSQTRSIDERASLLEATGDDAVAVAVGSPDGPSTRGPRPEGTDVHVLEGGSTPASVDAWRTAGRLDTVRDHVLALAGVVAAGGDPDVDAPEIVDAAREADRVDRGPGLAIPTADVADGLAHSTLVHAPWSGDEAAVEAALDPLTTPGEPHDVQRVASLVALDATGGDASQNAATAIRRVLDPYTIVDGPFETVGGYADVLTALATESPGSAVALGLGQVDRDGALDTWRDHGRRVHRGVADETTRRYDGLTVIEVTDVPVATTALVAQRYRSSEPTTLVVDESEVGIATAVDADEAGTIAESIVDEFGGGYDAGLRWARVLLERPTETDGSSIVSTVREVL